MSYTHGIRNLRISGILISSPYNGGNRLHLLLYNFRQLLKGEFHNFLPLLLSNQQFSVLRSGCTIPYHCILLITLFGFFEMKWTYVWIIHCKYTTNDLTICQSGQQDLNLRPHGPQPCALTKLSHTPLEVFYRILSKSASINWIYSDFFVWWNNSMVKAKGRVEIWK